jgi:outer membrane immunogenic protein
MHRLIAASIAMVGLGSSALAADLYTKAPPAPYYMSWTGFYAGVDVGYGWSDPTVTPTGNDPLAVSLVTGHTGNRGDQPVAPVSFNNKGAFGGGQIGYNWQLNRNWLVGLETDFNASDIKGQGNSVSVVDVGGITQQLSASQNIDWFGTVRARAGWLATDALLLYGTGGFAYGKVEERVNYGFNPAVIVTQGAQQFSCPGAFGQCVYGTSDRIATGWTAGGGAEYRVPGTSASFKVEYLFVDLGKGNAVTANALNVTPGATGSSISAAYSETQFHTVKLGLNWHF